MLKFTLIFCCALLALACANEDDQKAELTSSYQKQDELGNFENGFATSNGISIKAAGNVNGVQGEYVLPDGKIVKYRADSTGFHPIVD
ncbi:pupal cuticle protein Edg-78E [Scaptodrosophila lebanonensis]|uniref:Pupal cuticle protein Edg-78E n=1 Tax=Drosophila lebanonensis TaxID=7225 RepID=A0A6J2UID6_DROLE|nr:pupal cuticle protein Edg-78E [Scaptodrosophila lebanonensis]